MIVKLVVNLCTAVMVFVVECFRMIFLLPFVAFVVGKIWSALTYITW